MCTNQPIIIFKMQMGVGTVPIFYIICVSARHIFPLYFHLPPHFLLPSIHKFSNTGNIKSNAENNGDLLMTKQD